MLFSLDLRRLAKIPARALAIGGLEMLIQVRVHAYSALL
jgi:hypothetical protein